MRLIITETQYKNILKNYKQELILEASKLNILIEKEGLSEEQAQILDNLCGSLSVWMLGKIKEYQNDILKSWNKEISENPIEKINENELVKRVRQNIQGIMDWIRIGLNGNVKPFKDLSFTQLINKSVEWHENLDIGDGDINYVEKNEIIKDFRDENGNGFYWADLDTMDSGEEKERMGHCGRSRYGYIYSLRETRPINDKFKINKSHLTAAIGNDGILYQLKGPKNSKPKEEYHNLILPLFYVLGGEGEEDDYLIQGFGAEYASDQDFKLSDLPDDVIRDLYQNRPELFEGRTMMRKLVDMGIIDSPNIDYNIRLKIDSNDIGDYLDGDYVINRYKRKMTSPAGQEYERTIEVTLFEAILSGDVWELWENWEPDWKGALAYDVDNKNEQKIREILRKVGERDDEFIGEDFDEKDLEDIIEEYDEDYEIQRAIGNAVSNAESDAYGNYLFGELKDALQEYGTIENMDDDGVILHINTERYFDEVHPDYLNDYFERCDDDIECTFKEMLYEGDIEKPKVSIDDRYYPDIDRDLFNEILSDYLNEL